LRDLFHCSRNLGKLKSMKLGFLVPVKAIEAKREQLLWMMLMNYLTDRNDVWFR